MRSGKAYAVGGGRGADPARLEAVRRRFEVWRRTRRGRERIPVGLWASAVKLAEVYGVCRTAQALHLNYTALKDRIEATRPSDHRAGKQGVPPAGRHGGYMRLKDSPAETTPGRKMPTESASATRNPRSTPRISKPPQHNPAMTFLELAPAEHAGRAECMIELEHPRGAKMRIHIMGSPSPEVVTAVSKVFFGARR